MLCCKLNRRGRGSDIFLISAQNIDAGASQGGSHTWLFSQHFILCSDVNIMKLSLVSKSSTDTTKNHLNMKKTRCIVKNVKDALLKLRLSDF